MNLLTMYKDSFKLYNFKDFIQPFMFFIYYHIITIIKNVIDIDLNQVDWSIYIFSSLRILILPIICMFLYPIVAKYVTTTTAYQFLYPRNLFETAMHMLGNLLIAGHHIEDDITIRSNNKMYTAYRGYKSKSERRATLRLFLGCYYAFKFLLIDCILRGVIHIIMFHFAPIIYLIIVPMMFKSLNATKA